jgi:hypothetical protein
VHLSYRGFVRRSRVRLAIFQERKRGFGQGFSVNRLARRPNRVVRQKTSLASSAKKPFRKPSRCDTQNQAQTQTIQRHADPYGLMAAGGLVTATKRKSPFGFRQQRSQVGLANGERN